MGKTFSFRNKTKPINPARNNVKRFKTTKIWSVLFEGKYRVLENTENGIFQVILIGTGFSDFDRSRLKILTPK